MNTTSEAAPLPRSSRRSHRRRGRGRHARRFSGAIGTELKAWAEVIDGVLVAVEETAWSARRLAEAASGAVRDGERDFRAKSREAVDLKADVSRFAETGFTLARMAAGYRLHRLRAAFVSRRRAEAMLDDLHQVNARRFYETSARHGGAFLKVGQLLSARGDLLPEVWIRELEQLQDAAPTIPFEAIRGVIEADFGRSIEDLFERFEETPIAAASIGQVHRAVTKDGATVAVKVQRPGIGPRVEADLELLETFVGSLEDSLPDADYDTIFGQIREAVLAEIDYQAEANTARRLSDFFQGDPGIHVPRPVDGLCSEHVLTTEFAAGEKITVVLDRLAALAELGDDRAKRELSRILGLLLESYLRQVLVAGVFQADPHPGNLLVGPDGRVVLLDFGCAQVLPEHVRRGYLTLVQSFVGSDQGRLAEVFGELGFVTRSGRTDTLEKFAHALLAEIRQLALSQAVKWPTREELGKRFAGLLTACEDDPVVGLPGEFVMIARVFATIGGLFQAYHPEIDFVRHVLPVLGTAFLHQGE